jgi:hypothetical protein
VTRQLASSFYRPQTIAYRNCHSSRDEGLPLGNGCFGGMVYCPPGRLVFVLNHYDVYYRILPMHARKRQAGIFCEHGMPPYTPESAETAALAARGKPGAIYTETLHPSMTDEYGVLRSGGVHVVAGELALRLRDGAETTDRELSLDILAGRLAFEIGSADGQARLCAWILPDRPVLCIELNQTGRPWIEGFDLAVPVSRGKDLQRTPGARSDGLVWVAGAFHGRAESAAEGDDPFRFVLAARAQGWEPHSAIERNTVHVSAPGEPGAYAWLTTVATEFDGADPTAVASERLSALATALPAERCAHARYWAGFWARSRISLPDPMLERLWHLGLYTLDCACGRGAHLYQQACGLNGLWDACPPSQWGSMWYWDINIEEAFWPIYTANHLEIGQAYYDGLESYIPAAKKFARDYYHLEGIASDYPFTFYNCIWPWCAQNYWWHYRRSGDRQFLRERAMPLFRQILRFYEGRLRRDADGGEYHILPDISPEQGPLTQDSTITLACLRYLLRCALQGKGVLGERDAEAQTWAEMLAHLPAYAQGEARDHGTVVKDSAWAALETRLAHPSLLMPLYPTGEITPHSDPETHSLWQRTLAYARQWLPIGSHEFGWLAAAAARLGLGDQAVADLYGLGIDYQMRANGMFAEETERWIQNCLVTVEPVHNPPMPEGSSALVAALNEMLLQSHGGEVEVFPALPASWQDCAFSGLLAEGGFEVSARRAGGRTTEVEISSPLGGTLVLRDPFAGAPALVNGQSVDPHRRDGLIAIETHPGATYALRALSADAQAEPQPRASDGRPLVHEARSRRRVFLGKDEHTDFLRLLDDYVHDYAAGDQRVSRITVFKFDMSQPAQALPKDYRQVLERQMHGVGKKGPDFRRVTLESRYSREAGYGWETLAGLTYVDRGGPDPLRRDAIVGAQPNAFVVDLVAGAYRLLVVSGDAQEGNDTRVRVRAADFELGLVCLDRAGWFTARSVLVKLEVDTSLRIELDAPSGRGPWRLNALLVNKLP